MDKKERARIVAVKVNEVLAEEHSKRLEEVDAQIEARKKMMKLEELNKGVQDLYDKLKEAEKLLEDSVKTLSKDLPENMRLTCNGQPSQLKLNKHGFRYNSHWNGSDYVDVFYPDSSTHTEIITTLTQLRNTKNPRLKKVVDAGFRLMLEDDLEAMQEFLEL